MVDTPRRKLRGALCIQTFSVKNLGLALAPKMCADQSQAFKKVKNSQAFTVYRCSKACSHKTLAQIFEQMTAQDHYYVIFNPQNRIYTETK